MPHTHLKGQVRDDTRHSKANQEQVGEDEGSGCVDDLLDLFARAAGLTRLSAEQTTTIIRLLLFLLCFFSVCFCHHLLMLLSFSSSHSLSLQSMT